MINPSKVDDLLRDAKLVYDYCNEVGSLKEDQLLVSINAVENLKPEDRLSSAPEVTELRKRYIEARANLPFDVFYSLRNGWTIFPPRSKKWMTAGVVILAIAFMVCVLHLTRIYNRGVELSAELSLLEASQAERRYGELERKLLDTRLRLFPHGTSNFRADGALCGEAVSVSEANCDLAQPAGSEPDEKYLLAREASHLMIFELVNLDQRIKNLNVLVGEFQEQARYPIVGMNALEYSIMKFQSGVWTTLVSFVGCPVGSTAQNGGCAMMPASPKTPTFDTFYDPRLSGMSEIFCRKVDLLQQYIDHQLTKAQFVSADEFLGKVAYSLGDSFGVNTAQAIVQNCALGLSYYSGAIPDIEAINLRVKDKLNLYSMIILPAVYGALGAIVFFMRPLLNPKLPNPGITHTIYRIALGALAGMILAWLGMGMFGADEAFKSVGLGLFALAFILGFSIDVFFELLDRLVGISRGAVKKIGTPATEAAAEIPPGNGGEAGR